MAKKDRSADIFEDQDEDLKKGKKGKKGEKDEGPGKKGKKRKKKGGFFKFLLILLLIGLIVGTGLCFYFDWLHVRTTVLDFLSKIGPEGTRYTETLLMREEELTDKEHELEQKEADLQAMSDSLTDMEIRLSSWEEDLNDRDYQLTQIEINNTPAYRGELSDEKLAELKNLGKIYSSMDPDSAAMVLSQLYATADMASILYYMDKAAAAGVLAALSPEISAQITAEMLRE